MLAGSPIKGPPAQSESGNGGEGRGDGRQRPLTDGVDAAVSAKAISIAPKQFTEMNNKMTDAKNGLKFTRWI